MREWIIDIAMPTAIYFIGVAACISMIVLGAAVVTDIVNDPSEIMQEDGQ